MTVEVTKRPIIANLISTVFPGIYRHKKSNKRATDSVVDPSDSRSFVTASLYGSRD
jgi:hypothetical protein